MISPRYYRIDSLSHTFFDSLDVIIVGQSQEIRSHHIPKTLQGRFQGDSYKISYRVENEKFGFQRIDINNESDFEKIVPATADLIPNLIPALENIDLRNKTVLIDTTSVKHPLIFYFLRILKNDIKPKALFFAYAEPQKYIEDKSKIIPKFQLTEKFIGPGTIPGFLRSTDPSKDKALVVLMGFEGNRFKVAFEDIEPTRMKTFAVVGFPSFRPNWQFYVYDQNQSVLEQSKAYNNISRATANSPFGIYELLEKIKEDNEESNLIIAPLGTKPHSIGAGMFAVNHHDVQLYYDFPSFGKKIRTIGTGHSYIYNLTPFIND